jgi:ubiquinone/menaquinone biosynthesis C-methylase UbiE
MTHQHWTQYWRNAVSGSFGRQLPEWYRNTLEPVWKDTFLQLPQNARILDIATGNGAVINIANELSEQHNKNFTLIAIDKAKQLHPEPTTLNQIDFIADLAIEKIAFPANYFDIVCSQFGIEYSNRKKSLAKIAPCLKAGGKLLIVAHHKNSIIYKQSKAEVEQYRLVIQQHQFFKKLEILIRIMGELSSPSDVEKLQNRPDAVKARESFNKLASKLLNMHDDSIIITELLNNIKPLFRELMLKPVDSKTKFIQAIKADVLQARQRLLDMISSSMDEKSLHDFLSIASGLNMKSIVNKPIFNSNNDLIAWKLCLIKSESPASNIENN